MAEPSYTQTETLFLNKPDPGYFNWADIINENWDKLDKLGAGQLPLLTPLEVEHILQGADLIGWALQGSILDGSQYTSLWDLVYPARQRASVAINKTYEGQTYTLYQDALTGLVFVDTNNYNKGVQNLGDSLGMICTLSRDTKTIRLPQSSSYRKAALGSALPNNFLEAGLPNITGSFTAVRRGWGANNDPTGAFRRTATWNASVGGGDSDDWGGTFSFNASYSNSLFGKASTVQPQTKTVYRYYKVGNTVINSQQIDMGNVLQSISTLESEIDTLNYDLNQIKDKSQKFYNWNGYTSLGTGAQVYTASSAGMLGLFRASATDYSFVATIRATESSSSSVVGCVASAYKYSNGGSAWIAVDAGEKHYIDGAGACTCFFVPIK